MNGEKVLKLSDVIDIHPAHPFRGSIKGIHNGSARAVLMKDVMDDGSIQWDSLIRTELTGRRQPNWLQPDDILFLIRGSRNIAVFLEDVPFNCVISPHFLLLRAKPDAEILPAFAAWQMNQIPAQRYFGISAEGSAQRSIRKGVLSDLPIVIPPMTEQQAVINLSLAAKKEAAIYKKLIANREQEIRSVASRILNTTKDSKR